MPHIIDGYVISESNGSKTQLPSVTIRNPHGQLVGRLKGDKGRMWNRICNSLLDNPERVELKGQLLRSGVDAQVVEKILRPKE